MVRCGWATIPAALRKHIEENMETDEIITGAEALAALGYSTTNRFADLIQWRIVDGQPKPRRELLRSRSEHNKQDVQEVWKDKI